MTQSRNLGAFADNLNSSGILQTTGGGTGLTSLGTAGQVISVNSGATGLQFSTPSAGAMALISTKTASNSANLTWTGLSGYDKYLLIFQNIVPVTSNDLRFYFGEGSTPTYVTSGYTISTFTAPGNSNTITGSGRGTGLAYGSLSGTFSPASTGSGASGSMLITNFLCANGNNTSFLTNLSWFDGTNYATTSGSGVLTADTTAKTALQIFANGSNISTGTASLYGISS